MKVGARNKLMGKVTAIKKGAVMGQVNLEITGKNSMASVMTMDSLRDLGIKKGDRVRIVVKAISVLLVKE